uniref:Uncharacterized protein n=1 Tax=Romanomermis culicivorax TaxID=13658 RepID=A0A915KD02_ROMCU
METDLLGDRVAQRIANDMRTASGCEGVLLTCDALTICCIPLFTEQGGETKAGDRGTDGLELRICWKFNRK